MGLPSRYSYLLTDPFPPVMVRVGLGMYGTYEDLRPGKSNKLITNWADEVERAAPNPYNNWAADYMNSDKIPWCALWMGVCAVRSAGNRPERMPPKGYLAAMAWSGWGVGVPKKIENIMIGDVIVLNNPTHVTMAVGVTSKGTIAGLGGNQSNSVRISEYPMSRVYAIRRPPYLTHPEGARHVKVGSTGILSDNDR